MIIAKSKKGNMIKSYFVKEQLIISFENSERLNLNYVKIVYLSVRITLLL